MSITTDTINGRAKGRAVPSLPTHTFRDSGITVKLHKLSPMTSQELMLQVKREMHDTEPQPPMVEVDYGNGKVLEPHRGHPIYIEKLKEWESAVNREANDRLFRLACLVGVELDLDNAAIAAIERRKRYLKLVARIDWQGDPELTEAENNQIFYVTHICCASTEDLQEFYQAIATRSQPTEAAVEQYKSSFPGDIQGQEHLEP